MDESNKENEMNTANNTCSCEGSPVNLGMRTRAPKKPLNLVEVDHIEPTNSVSMESGIDRSTILPPENEYETSADLQFLERLTNAKQRLQPGYRPAFPAGREKELELLKNKLKSVVETRCGGSLHICGAPGRGKTMTVEYAIKWLKLTYEENTQNTSFSKYEILLMNGTAFPPKNYFSYLMEKLEISPTNIGEELNFDVEDEGRRCLLQHFLAPTQKNTSIRFGKRTTSLPPMTILVIDEIDKAPRAFTRSLFEMSKAVNSTLFLIGLSNFSDIADMLKLSAAVWPDICVFEQYKREALARIVNYRAPNLFHKLALSICANKAYKSGFSRYYHIVVYISNAT
jgi:Cdc6-like AAA superfamily ATPase